MKIHLAKRGKMFTSRCGKGSISVITSNTNLITCKTCIRLFNKELGVE